MTEGTDQ